jgi:Fur family ferric uptake transcriptional regulator
VSDDLRDALRAAGRRVTSQRQLILEVLEASSHHLDAEALYERAKARDSDISLATIYRTLALFSELGLVREHRLSGRRTLYEPMPDEPHYHFTCLGCGEAIDFGTPLVRLIEQELREREGVSVTSTVLLISGFCAQCRADSE